MKETFKSRFVSMLAAVVMISVFGAAVMLFLSSFSSGKAWYGPAWSVSSYSSGVVIPGLH